MTSNEYNRGYALVETDIQDAIFVVGIEKTKELMKKGYDKLVQERENKKSSVSLDFIQGCLNATVEFLKRHNVEYN